MPINLFGLIINNVYICLVFDKNEMSCKQINQLEEVFRNDDGAVYQCSAKNCYCLEFKGEATDFKVADFLNFKKQVDRLDVSALLTNSSRSADFTILMPFRCNRCFVLTVLEVVQLKELLDAARYMIELNSLLTDCLGRRRSDGITA